MPIVSGQLDIEKGTLVLIDDAGARASYHRVLGSFTRTVLHAMLDQGDLILFKPLTDAETFPGELIVNHSPPGQVRPLIGAMDTKWADAEFRYVRDDASQEPAA